MDKLNFYYYYSLYITLIVYCLNLLLMINILINDYHSMSTISTFFSFSLLVQIKLYNSFVIAKESIKNDKMMSAYMSEFVSFNVLDEDYVKAKLENTLHKEEEELKNELQLEEIPITIEENRQVRQDRQARPDTPKPPKSLEVIIPQE